MGNSDIQKIRDEKGIEYGDLSATTPISYNSTTGEISFNGLSMDDLQDVNAPTPSNNHLLVYNISAGEWRNSQSLTLFNLTINGTLSGVETTEITEGTNLYYTNERVDDRVSNLLTAGTGISLTYDDVANTLTIAVVTEDIQDIVGGMVSGNVETGIAVTYDDTNGKLDFSVIAPAAPSWASTLVVGRTSSGNNPQLTTTDRLEFRDNAIYIYSEADANLSIVADGQIRIDAGTQFLADEGMTINLPSVSAYNVGFRVDASSAGYPGIRFLRTATSAGDIVFGTTSADYHVFGSLGSTKVGDVTHTDGTRSMTFDASAGELAVTNGTNTLRLDAVNNRFEIGANNGASGSFTSADGKTITITGGIVTSIV